jgi:hypothetical protein
MSATALFENEDQSPHLAYGGGVYPNYETTVGIYKKILFLEIGEKGLTNPIQKRGELGALAPKLSRIKLFIINHLH